MGADYLFYVNIIAIRAPTFFGHIISVLASVTAGQASLVQCGGSYRVCVY